MKKNGKKFGSDFAKLDVHVIQPEEYEELPLLTDEMAARGVRKRGGKPVGRPRKTNKKVSLHLRIDPDVRDSYRATGAGWQSRIHDLLREHMPR